ncbi:hypothetical protein BDFB_004347 [Asbolus verrucosus]|uniref:Uncharacterized protein n=1 Tax=Asbolus verrucosus TaxID=1661398 RepID=A0A482VF76_ASBVE|nr:hypothetical protein BDFB_004347 [Asbolus verrucosus]
MPNRILLEFL